MGGISVEVIGIYRGREMALSEAFDLATSDFVARLEDKSLLFAQVSHEVLEPAVMEQFDTEGAAGDTPWVALAPATEEIRKRKGFGPSHPILEQTGDLRDSFRASGAGHIEEFGPDSGMWGSRSHGFHQTTHDNIPFNTRNPARPILYWNEILQTKAELVLRNWGTAAALDIFEVEPTALLPTW